MARTAPNCIGRSPPAVTEEPLALPTLCPQGRDRLKFCCRCSMLEIYNEVITDLLNPTATNLQVRGRHPHVHLHVCESACVTDVCIHAQSPACDSTCTRGCTTMCAGSAEHLAACSSDNMWLCALGPLHSNPHAPAWHACAPRAAVQVREDVKRGCYVEGLSEEIVQNGEPGSSAILQSHALSKTTHTSRCACVRE
jgi:hypothetical protein